MTGIRMLPVGECALSVEFGDTVDAETNARVLALDDAMGTSGLPGIIECVPTYRALMIHYDPLTTPFADLRAEVARIAEMAAGGTVREHRGSLWRIPVAYGSEFGIDLADLAGRHGLAESAVIDLHAGTTYRIYMLGFAPGFAYLGDLPDRLHTPRRTEPRLSTPAGSVSIGGAQTAITSVAVPSGWHLIGRTPYATFDPRSERAFLLAPGDRVRFEPIGHADWDILCGRIARGEFRPEPEDAK